MPQALEVMVRATYAAELRAEIDISLSRAFSFDAKCTESYGLGQFESGRQYSVHSLAEFSRAEKLARKLETVES